MGPKRPGSSYSACTDSDEEERQPEASTSQETLRPKQGLGRVGRSNPTSRTTSRAETPNPRTPNPNFILERAQILLDKRGYTTDTKYQINRALTEFALGRQVEQFHRHKLALEKALELLNEQLAREMLATEIEKEPESQTQSNPEEQEEEPQQEPEKEGSDKETSESESGEEDPTNPLGENSDQRPPRQPGGDNPDIEMATETTAPEPTKDGYKIASPVR